MGQSCIQTMSSLFGRGARAYLCVEWSRTTLRPAFQSACFHNVPCSIGVHFILNMIRQVLVG